jgi:hypothetical protein
MLPYWQFELDSVVADAIEALFYICNRTSFLVSLFWFNFALLVIGLRIIEGLSFPLVWVFFM